MSNHEDVVRVAIGCQGGGSHTAYTAGVLDCVLEKQQEMNVRITGFSGTSGGAICALLAWYGVLKGGVPEAQRRLGEFWRRNSVRNLWEVFWNSTSLWSASLPVQIKTTPYAPPLSWIIEQAKMWAPRPEWIDLRRLLEAFVSFEEIAKLGALEALQADVGNWLRVESWHQLGMEPEMPTPVLKHREIIEAAEAVADLPMMIVKEKNEEISIAVDVAKVIAIARRQKDWDLETVSELHQALRALRRKVPSLAVGAVNILTGEFCAFNSKKNQITVNHILASAAIPSIYTAVKEPGPDRMCAYWDGLFSENPPIKQFVAEPDSSKSKPDEIWIVQINPQDCPDVPTTADEIDDRRNELSGNLSLNQEISSIQAVNRWLISASLIKEPHYKPVKLYWIPMNEAAVKSHGWNMDPASKLNRSAGFLDALSDHGKVQARIFMVVRNYLERVWIRNEPPRSGEFAPPQIITAMYNHFPGCAYFEINRMSIIPKEGDSRATNGTVKIEWAMHGSKDGKSIDIAGAVDLSISQGQVVEGRVQKERVTRATHISVPAVTKAGGRP